MNMNDGASVRPVAEAVELAYRITTADLAEAVRARDSRTAAGRRRRWLFPVTGIMSVLLALSAIARDESAARVAVFFAAGAMMWVFALFSPRIQARAFRGLLEKAGECRTVVDGSGVLVATATTEARISWAAQPTYAETDGSFVMLSDDKGAVAMTVLPKRGVQDPADVDRLRAILDASLRRI
ncbi:YcxB family protein [Streptomyces sp. NPDC048269]|uniref:YcxB family protein n=1 Tax=Streptomyces sp. NPDC048269 TaxID=3155753 RepID=UPI00343EA1CD